MNFLQRIKEIKNIPHGKYSIFQLSEETKLI